jgi:hypothetical protein
MVKKVAVGNGTKMKFVDGSEASTMSKLLKLMQLQEPFSGRMAKTLAEI